MILERNAIQLVDVLYYHSLLPQPIAGENYTASFDDTNSHYYPSVVNSELEQQDAEISLGIIGDGSNHSNSCSGGCDNNEDSDEVASSSWNWTQSQFNELIDSVWEHQGKNWRLISERVSGRSWEQCKTRWYETQKKKHFLTPEQKQEVQSWNNRRIWTQLEKKTLCELVMTGMKMKDIARKMRKRFNSCQSQWNRIRHKKEDYR